MQWCIQLGNTNRSRAWPNPWFIKLQSSYFCFLCLVLKVQTSEPTYAPLAQLVEHLTLNQGVQGSSPWRCTNNGPLVKWPKTPASHAGNTSSNLVRVTIDLNESKKEKSGWEVQIVGVFSDEGPPVPIPNTEVKLISADNTWLEAAREDKAMPTQYHLS